MSDNSRILPWLRTLPSNLVHPPSPAPKVGEKRKFDFTSTQHPISPPSSLEDPHDMPTTPSGKKRCASTSNGHVLYDPDDSLHGTPLANPITRRISEASVPSSSHGSFSDTSSISGASSPNPKKQRMSLELSDTGVEYASLNEQTVPDVAKDLFNRMMTIGRGLDILPESSKAEVMDNLRRRNLNWKQWKYCFMSPQEVEEEALPARLPSFVEISKIVRKATECENNRHEEVSWNNQVHMRLLEAIFEDAEGKLCDNFNALSCTTARPHRDFRPTLSTSKMIDICIYHSSEHNDALNESMAKFRQLTPTLTVNHTDFDPIKVRPLIISIETKKPGVEWEKAKIQIGVWHAAQWAFLRWSIGQKLLRHMSEEERVELMTEDAQTAFVEKKLKILDELGFIPGVIIQGNRWHLVLSTYEKGKTKLWADWVFGSTKSEMEGYAVVAGVRKLTAWGRDVYLPWFERNVFGWPDLNE